MRMKKIFLPRFLISVILSFALCVTMFPALANGPSPGITTYELDRGYLLSVSEAELSDEDMIFADGGQMNFDLLLPFDSEAVTLKYKAETDGEITINIDGKTYTKAISASETTKTFDIDRVVFGSHTIGFVSVKAIKITSVNFQKIDESFHELNGLETELTDYEYALLNSVVFKDGSGVVKAKGAFRRLDYNNLSMTPVIAEGSMYVPLNVIAPELGFYYEDYPEKSYILLRGEGIDLELVAGKGTVSEDLSVSRDVTLDVIYSNGITWVPLRKLSETMNFYVEYRDGYAVIDDRLSAKKVVNDDKIFAELCEEFSKYSLSNIKAGNVYHVATENELASDNNSGTEKYPFKTLQKAGQVAKAGDTVIIHKGTYREILTPQNDGTAMAPITFCAAEGENVLISALEPLANFVQFKNNIYCASVGKDLGVGKNQLFYKGEALTEGRHPNKHTKVETGGTHAYPKDVPDIWPVKGNISIKVNNIGNSRKDGFNVATSITDLWQSKDYWKGGTYVGIKGEAWTLVSGDIVSSSYGQLVLADHPGSESYGLGIDTEYYRLSHKPDYGFITNHINTVDMPGEWYMGEGVMYVYPPEGADLNSDFEVKQRQTTIDLTNRQYITIKNINTVGGGMTLMGDMAKGCVIDGGSHRYISHFTRTINQSGGTASPSRKGEMGILLGGARHAVINTDINFSASMGIGIFGRDHYVYNNNIGNTSYGGEYPGAIYISRLATEEPLGYYGNHVVRNNTLYNGGRALVTMGGGAIADMGNKYQPFVGNELSYNRIYQGSIAARDTGLVYQYGYTGGNDKRRSQMHHNWVYDCMLWDQPLDTYNPDTNPNGIGTGAWHIYQDGLTANQDTYCNLTFETNEATKGAPGGTYEQVQPYTQVRQRGNSDLGYFPEGIDGLKNESFPGGKPFFAGSYHDGREKFMMNYNNLSEGIKAYSPDKSQVIESSWDFSDVRFLSSGYSSVYVDYVCDTDETRIFDASVTLKSAGGDVVSEVTMPVSTAASGNDSKLKTAVIPVPNDKEGTYDVNLTFDDEHSRVLRLRTGEGYPEMEDIINPKVIYAGSYDDFIEGKSSGEIYPLVKNIHSDKLSVEQGIYYTLHNTWTHTVIYNDREIKEDCDTLEIMYGAGPGYDGQSVKIYMDSMESEPVADFVIENTNWGYAVKTIKLNRTLTKGTHTLYVKFSNDSKCSDVAYFDFYNSSTRETEGN